MPKIRNIFSYPGIKGYLIIKTIFDVLAIFSKVFDLTPLNQISWIITIYTIVPIIVVILYAVKKQGEVLSNQTIILLFSDKKKVRVVFRLLIISITGTLIISKMLGDTMSSVGIITFVLAAIAWEGLVRKIIKNNFFIFIQEKRE